MALDIESMSEGFSQAGIEEFVSSVEQKIADIQAAVRDLGAVKEVIQANWTGKAADNFIKNLDARAERLCVDLKTAIEAIGTEINNAGARMAQFDDELIVEEHL